MEQTKGRQKAYQEWIGQSNRFKALTGNSRFSVDSLESWAREHADRLVEELTPEEYVDLATWAAGHYQNVLLSEMIKRVPDVLEDRDQGGHTVLHTAAWAHNAPAFRMLTTRWPYPSQPCDEEGRRPLECLLLSRKEGLGIPWKARNWAGTARDCLRAAHEVAPHWIEERLEGGNTLLHIAAGSQHPRTVCRDLMGYGLAWNDPNIAGFTPADVLEHNQHYQPSVERGSDSRDVQFLTESLEAGRVPRKKPSLIARALARFSP